MKTTNPRAWSTDNYPNPSVTSFTAKFAAFGRSIPVTLWYGEGMSTARFCDFMNGKRMNK